MTHVIGLFAHDLEYDRSIGRLKVAGFQPAKIGLMSREQVVTDVLGCKSGKIIAKYAGGGALLGLAAYGTSALLASWCQCNLFNFGEIVQLTTLIGGILAGMFVGSSLGVFVGIGKLEEVTTLYSQGRFIDGKMVDIRVSSKQADHIKDILQHDGACEVRVI